MKFLISTLILAFIPLFGETLDQEEILLRELIATTKKNLEGQQKILKILQEFNKAREGFIEEPTSGKLATKLVRVSMLLYNEIEKYHLSHLFSKEFFKEIQFFNQIGEKQKITCE